MFTKHLRAVVFPQSTVYSQADNHITKGISYNSKPSVLNLAEYLISKVWKMVVVMLFKISLQKLLVKLHSPKRTY